MDNDLESAARCKRQITQASGCILTPEAVEGPYYWNSTIRQNITDGKGGIPLRLSIAVYDTNNCTPLVNALVDLWHCDAIGIYSHYIAASQGISGSGNDNETFLRGLGLTDANGIATFDTIYPGWYSGRATHIHVKVHVGMNITSNSSGTYSGGHVSHTGQLFFNDTLTDAVAHISPYSNHTITRTRNAADSIYASANGSVTIVSIRENSMNNYTGMVTLGVDSSAIPVAVAGGEMGPGIGEIPPNEKNFSMPMGPGIVQIPLNEKNFSIPLGPGIEQIPPNEKNFSMPLGPGIVQIPPNEKNFSIPLGPGIEQIPPNEKNFSMPLGPGIVQIPPNEKNFSMPMGPGIVLIPPNENNFSMPMVNMTAIIRTTTTTTKAAASTFFVSLSPILFAFLLRT